MASKYVRGEQIQSLDELIAQKFIYFNHKVYHRGWFRSWQLNWVAYAMYLGRIHKAIPIKRVEPKFMVGDKVIVAFGDGDSNKGIIWDCNISIGGVYMYLVNVPSHNASGIFNEKDIRKQEDSK